MQKKQNKTKKTTHQYNDRQSSSWERRRLILKATMLVFFSLFLLVMPQTASSICTHIATEQCEISHVVRRPAQLFILTGLKMPLFLVLFIAWKGDLSSQHCLVVGGLESLCYFVKCTYLLMTDCCSMMYCCLSIGISPVFSRYKTLYFH